MYIFVLQKYNKLFKTKLKLRFLYSYEFFLVESGNIEQGRTLKKKEIAAPLLFCCINEYILTAWHYIENTCKQINLNGTKTIARCHRGKFCVNAVRTQSSFTSPKKHTLSTLWNCTGDFHSFSFNKVWVVVKHARALFLWFKLLMQLIFKQKYRFKNRKTLTNNATASGSTCQFWTCALTVVPATILAMNTTYLSWLSLCRASLYLHCLTV